MSKKQALILFKFRTRMAPFGENFKAGKFSSVCPLCSAHIDSQEESFTCSALNKMLQIRGKYSDIFTNKISEELTQTLESIYIFRKEFED